MSTSEFLGGVSHQATSLLLKGFQEKYKIGVCKDINICMYMCIYIYVCVSTHIYTDALLDCISGCNTSGVLLHRPAKLQQACDLDPHEPQNWADIP